MVTKNEQFIQAMRDAVAERGKNYVYPEAVPNGVNYFKRDDYHNPGGVCMYSTPDGTPACIIGLALDKMGEPVPEYGNMVGADCVLEYLVSPYVCNAARQAQLIQDKGGTWGEALAVFEKGVQL